MRPTCCLSVLLVFFVPIAARLAYAAPAGPAGTIQGTVADTANAILPGATVKLDQGSLTVTSDTQGQFTIINVATGAHTVEVNYLGFAPSKESITVSAGATAHLNVVMNVASASESVLVTAERAHGEAEALNEEKVSDNVLNVLPDTVITSLPNANVADAVGRLPGVTVERDEGEARFPQIRGTEPRLSSLTIDGVEVPAPQSSQGGQVGQRQVPLDVIPAELLDSVQISKTLAPNMNGEAIGGTVNVVTRRAGDKPSLSVYGMGGFTPIDNTRLVREFGGTAGKSFGARNQLGLMVSGSYDYNSRGIDDVEPGPPWGVSPGGIPYVTTAALRQYLYDRTRYGFAGSADYKLSEVSRVYVNYLYSDFKDYGNRYEYIINPGFVGPDPNNPVATPSLPSFTTERRNPDFQIADVSLGGNHVFGTSLFNWQFAVGRAKMMNPIGGGESHNIFGANTANFPNGSSCQYLGSPDPYVPQFNSACFNEAYNPANLVLTQIQQSGHGQDVQLNLQGTISMAKNYHIGSHSSTFETGFYLRNAHKFDDSYEIDASPNSGVTLPATMFLDGYSNSNYYNGHYRAGPGVSWNAVNAYWAAHPDQFTVTPLSSVFPNSNNFNLVERVTAGYIMNSVDFSRFRLTGGVRIEGTQDDTRGFDPTLGTLSVRGGGTYISVLPSASVRVRLDSQNNSDLRFVYARGLSRPDPVFLTSATSLDNSTHPFTVTIANPALKPEYGNNFDILFEHYLHPLGSIQAGFFYKSLTSPIVLGQTGPLANIPGCSDPSGTCFVDQATNSGSAHIEGVEISFQQHFTYLPGLLSGLGILANYGYAASAASNVNPAAHRTGSPSLLRTAPNTWNISPTYDRGRFSLRTGLSYNGPNIFLYTFTPFVHGSNPPTPTPLGLKGPFGDTYLYSHLEVDAQGSVYLWKGLTLLVSGMNLNNEVFGFYQGSPQFPIQREFYKPTYTFGLRWDLHHERP